MTSQDRLSVDRDHGSRKLGGWTGGPVRTVCGFLLLRGRVHDGNTKTERTEGKEQRPKQDVDGMDDSWKTK